MARALPLLAIVVSLVLPSAAALTFSEIMYNPPGDDDGSEWLELILDEPGQNLSEWLVGDSSSNDSLSLIKLVNSSIALIVENGSAPTDLTISVWNAGAAIGNGLNNNGDCIFIWAPNGSLVDKVCYDGSLANGNNHSLEFRDELWLESAELGGSPGRINGGNATAQNASGQTNLTASSQTDQASGCNVSLSIATDKMIYQMERIEFRHILSQRISNFSIEYWIEDLLGQTIKARRNTTNTNPKHYTPRYKVREQTLVIKAFLRAECDSYQGDNYAEAVVIALNPDAAEAEEKKQVSAREPSSQQKPGYRLLRWPTSLEAESPIYAMIELRSKSSPAFVELNGWLSAQGKPTITARARTTLQKYDEKVLALSFPPQPAGFYELEIEVMADARRIGQLFANITILNQTLAEKAAPQSKPQLEPASFDEQKNNITADRQEVIYRSSSSRAKALAPSLLMGLLGLLSSVLIWRR